MTRIYDRPVHQLLRELAQEQLTAPDSILSRQDAIAWFAKHYPKIKTGTVAAHLIKFSTNDPTRLNYNYHPGQDDVLFRVQPGRYRRYDPASDPTPIATPQGKAADGPGAIRSTDDSEEAEPSTGSEEFAYERDLRNYLSANLNLLEPGLHLYEDEDITGVEFPVGGRFVDILAVSAQGEYVVIELKVSRGYDRVVGQLLRYVAWIKENHAEPSQQVRGIIVAREISGDLLLACSLVPGVRLFEYDLQVRVQEVHRLGSSA